MSSHTQSSAGMEAGGGKDGGVDGQTDREDESMEGRASQGPVVQVALPGDWQCEKHLHCQHKEAEDRDQEKSE